MSDICLRFSMIQRHELGHPYLLHIIPQSFITYMPFGFNDLPSLYPVRIADHHQYHYSFSDCRHWVNRAVLVSARTSDRMLLRTRSHAHNVGSPTFISNCRYLNIKLQRFKAWWARTSSELRSQCILLTVSRSSLISTSILLGIYRS